MPSLPDPEALKTLDSVVQSASALLKQLQAVLTDIHKNPASLDIIDANDNLESSTSTSAASLDALSLARNSSSLIRAHGTKISLLIINEPFTPSAIVTVVRDLVSGPVPGIVSSVQACTPSLYTALFRRELAWRCQRVLSELNELIQKIPGDGKALAGGKKNGSGANKGSIASTGLLWSACDSTASLVNLGIGGFFVTKVDEWRDTLKDIMEELKEWGDEEPDDDVDDDSADNDVSGLTDQMEGSHVSTQAMLDDIMNSQRSIPLSDPDRIRPRLESSLTRLRLVSLLYQAINKRRLKTLPPLPSTSATGSHTNVPQRLDEAASILRRLPDRFNDLAGAFYELQPLEIDQAMDQCFLDAFAASELLSAAWDGGRDEFADWTNKFQLELKKELKI